jgi:hypothetical protein
LGRFGLIRTRPDPIRIKKIKSSDPFIFWSYQVRVESG